MPGKGKWSSGREEKTEDERQSKPAAEDIIRNIAKVSVKLIPINAHTAN